MTSRFAEHRSYFVDGEKISEAIHYGYDLASTAAAPITAANAGRVVYAGDLGIYGNCVLIDHGLGLATLYGHLSRIDVARGRPGRAGRRRSGSRARPAWPAATTSTSRSSSGDSYVDPLEWWDPNGCGRTSKRARAIER